MVIMTDKSGKKFWEADVLGRGSANSDKGGGGQTKGRFLRTSYVDIPFVIIGTLTSISSWCIDLSSNFKFMI
jgi:hypothetical protein